MINGDGKPVLQVRPQDLEAEVVFETHLTVAHPETPLFVKCIVPKSSGRAGGVEFWG